jgi:hypothetical protein
MTMPIAANSERLPTSSLACRPRLRPMLAEAAQGGRWGSCVLRVAAAQGRRAALASGQADGNSSPCGARDSEKGIAASSARSFNAMTSRTSIAAVALRSSCFVEDSYERIPEAR